MEGLGYLYLSLLAQNFSDTPKKTVHHQNNYIYISCRELASAKYNLCTPKLTVSTVVRNTVTTTVNTETPVHRNTC